MKENIFLRAIEYWYKNPEWFYYHELLEEVGANEQEKNILYKYIQNADKNTIKYASGWYPNLETIFYPLLNQGVRVNDENRSSFKYILTSESLFNYLDYLELKQSRENAKQASDYAKVSIKIAKKSVRVAIWALILAIITSFISIYFSNKQINSPVTINQAQIDSLSWWILQISKSIEWFKQDTEDTNQYLDDIDSKILQLLRK